MSKHSTLFNTSSTPTTQLTHYQLKDASRKMQIIQDYQQSNLNPKTYCQTTTNTPSYQTLYRWLKDYKQGGYNALANHYGSTKGLTTISQNTLDQILKLYLTENKLNLRYCLAIIQDKTGQHISYDAARRAVQNIPQSVIDRYRHGAKYYNDKHTAHIRRDYSLLKVMQTICMDHHLIDVFIRSDDGTKARRVWLTCAQDMRSRYIIAWRIVNTPTELSIADCLYDITTNHGIAQSYYIDNGKDFTGNLLAGNYKKEKRQLRNKAQKLLYTSQQRRTEIQGIYASLGSQVIFATPYHPEAKPIERFFKEVNQQFSRLFTSYAGSNTADRPDQVKELWTKSKHNITKLPNLQDLILSFDNWINWWNTTHAHHGNSMNGRTPYKVFTTETRIKRKNIPEEYLPLVFSREEKRQVYQGQVVWNNTRYYADKLILYSGQNVSCLRPIYDTNTLYIRDAQGRVICEAKANALLETGKKEQDLRILSTAKKAQKQLLKQHTGTYGSLPTHALPHIQVTKPDVINHTSRPKTSAVKKSILREDYL